MNKLAIHIIFCSLTILTLRAQDSSWVQRTEFQQLDTLPKVVLLANYDEGRIQLRFAINQASFWYANIPYGYKIERYEINPQNGLADRASRDTVIVKAWPLRQFEPLNQNPESNKYHLTIAECLYGGIESEGGKQQFGRANKEIQNKHGLALFAADMNFAAAQAGGMAWEDSIGIVEGQTYFYRVRALLPDSTVLPAYTTISASSSAAPSPELAVCLEGEGKVTLQWERDLHEPFFSAYWVERSKDSLKFERIHQIPFVGGQSKAYPSPYFSYTDQIPLYESFYYRIRGVTPFGKISPPSVAVRLMARDRTACAAADDLLINTDAILKKVSISWSQENCGDLLGWQVYKGAAPELPFEPVGSLIPAGSKPVFQETIEDTRSRLYYKIQTLDTAGNGAFTLARLAAFRDTLPPNTPIGLKGVIDSSGVVHLQWKPNEEEDLRGYHIFKANAADHIFTMVNAKPFPDATFKDTITLQTLTEKIYYRVSAVDFQGHISKYSEPLELIKPDTIAPFPPSIVRYGQTEKHIYFDWTPSRTKDVVLHTLYRKVNSEEWKKVETFEPVSGRFIDRNVGHDSIYAYKIIATDDAGLNSVDHASIRTKFKTKKLPDPPLFISCTVINKNHIKLTWKPVAESESEIFIYKSINDGPFTVLERVAASKLSYLDRRSGRNFGIKYALKIKDQSGKRSPFSNILTPENIGK